MRAEYVTTFFPEKSSKNLALSYYTFSLLFLTTLSQYSFSILFLTTLSHYSFSLLFLTTLSHYSFSLLFLTTLSHYSFSLLFLTTLSHYSFSLYIYFFHCQKSNNGSTGQAHPCATAHQPSLVSQKTRF